MRASTLRRTGRMNLWSPRRRGPLVARVLAISAMASVLLVEAPWVRTSPAPVPKPGSQPTLANHAEVRLPPLTRLPLPQPGLTAPPSMPIAATAPSAPPPASESSDQFRADLHSRFAAALPAAQIEIQGDEIVITGASDPLFALGTAQLNANAVNPLRESANWLATQHPKIQVTIESHTDDSPVVRHRRAYRSNWDLSAARAAALVMLFSDAAVPTANLKAVGRASSQPVGSTSETNRRIVIRLREPKSGAPFG